MSYRSVFVGLVCRSDSINDRACLFDRKNRPPVWLTEEFLILSGQQWSGIDYTYSDWDQMYCFCCIRVVVDIKMNIADQHAILTEQDCI